MRSLHSISSIEFACHRIFRRTVLLKQHLVDWERKFHSILYVYKTLHKHKHKHKHKYIFTPHLSKNASVSCVHAVAMRKLKYSMSKVKTQWIWAASTHILWKRIFDTIYNLNCKSVYEMVMFFMAFHLNWHLLCDSLRSMNSFLADWNCMAIERCYDSRSHGFDGKSTAYTWCPLGNSRLSERVSRVSKNKCTWLTAI